ncbi:MAG: putative quinol monooxygenase [Pseudomonadota bacterium]
MILIEGTVRIPEGALERTRPAMEKMIAASRAEEGCIDYAYSVDVLDSSLIRIAERWRSRADLAAHFKTPHMDDWRKAVAEAGVTERSLRLYEAEPEDF